MKHSKQYKRDRTLIFMVLTIFLVTSYLANADEKPQKDRREIKPSLVNVIDHANISKRISQAVKPKYKWVTVTAYDLSIQSCGKLPSSRGYGITRSGKSLKGKSWKVRAIAVDPKVIKMGSKVRITFTGWREKYNGIYVAVDTGGAIKGNKIDLFLGENSYKECIKFGRVKAKIEILEVN